MLGCSIFPLGFQPPRIGNAEQCQATGIVGVEIQENRHRWNSHTIEFLAIGTAVIPSQEAPPVRPPMPVISFDR